MVAANTAMKAENVKQGSWTENLGPDEYVAVDDAGNVISRSDKATLERTHPNATLFGARDFPKSVLRPAPEGEPIKDALKAAHDANTEAENSGRHAKIDELQAAQVDALEKDGVKLNDPLDHDRNGRKGGNISARKTDEASKQKSNDIGSTKDQGGKAAASKAGAKK